MIGKKLFIMDLKATWLRIKLVKYITFGFSNNLRKNLSL